MKAILDEIKDILERTEFLPVEDMEKANDLCLQDITGMLQDLIHELTAHEGESEPKFSTLEDMFGDLPPRTDWQELRMAFTIWRCNLKGKIRNALRPAPPVSNDIANTAKEGDYYEAEHPEECCPTCGMLEIVCGCEDGE